MERSFGIILSELRHKRDLSQRQLAGDLHISQALLSHYENGTREPGLPFVCRVCEYFGVSSDYMLGRSNEETSIECGTGAVIDLNRALTEISDNSVRRIALDYVDSAAKKITALLTYHDELFIAEQSAAMANAELNIVRMTSQNKMPS